jgi:hypothetical protein
MCALNGAQQVGREHGGAALSRQVLPHKGDLVNPGTFAQWLILIETVPALTSGLRHGP